MLSYNFFYCKNFVFFYNFVLKLKNIMKKIILFLLIFTNFLQTFWYNPEQEELEIIQNINQNIEENYYNSTKSEFFDFLQTLKFQKEELDKNSKKYFILNEMFNFGTNLALEKEKESKSSQNKLNYSKNLLLDNYLENITTDIYIEEKCVRYYDFIDNIAKEHNFPTALIIATWRKENSCNMINPQNQDWVFQILHKYYTPWEITLEELWVQIVDFIEFSKYKWDYYDKLTKIPAELNHEKINISYYDYTLKDLQIHWVIYNWYSWKSTLESNKYVSTNLYPENTWRTDWIVTTFIKILDREQKNKTL